jgi:hypothetical protein
MKLKKDTNCYSKTFTGYVEENFNWKMKLICTFKSFLNPNKLRILFKRKLYFNTIYNVLQILFARNGYPSKVIVRCFA